MNLANKAVLAEAFPNPHNAPISAILKKVTVHRNILIKFKLFTMDQNPSL